MPTELGRLLHVAAVSYDGRLWHAVRYANAGWSQFADVQAQCGSIGAVLSADVQNVGKEVHLCAVNSFRELHHTIRRADGSWYAFGNVNWVTGYPAMRFEEARMAELLGELHLIARDTSSQLWHTIRHQNGAWEPFRKIPGAVFPSFDCAGIYIGLHVVGVDWSGSLSHFTRSSLNGVWSAFGDIHAQAAGRAGGDRNKATVGCDAMYDRLHVVATSRRTYDPCSNLPPTEGFLYHTERLADGTWTQMRTIPGQHGHLMCNAAMGSAGETRGELQVALTTLDGRAFHILRRTDGTWTSFGDMEAVAGQRPPFASICVDGLFNQA